GFWLGTTTGGAFVTDFAAGTGRRTGVRGNGGRVVVGFDLHQDVHVFLMVGVVAAIRIREETTGFVAHNHRGIVFISRQDVVVVALVGVLDHLEQGLVLFFAVDGPAGVEDLVAAVLGVGLREHHQFHIGRVTTQRAVVVQQVIDSVVGQRQTQCFVGSHQRLAATGQNSHSAQRRRFGVGEQTRSAGTVFQHGFHHTVVQYRCGGGTVSRADAFSIISNAALQTLHTAQAAVVGNVGGF